MIKKIIPFLFGIIILSTNGFAQSNLIMIIDSSHFMKSSDQEISKIKTCSLGLNQFIDTIDKPMNIGMIISGNNRKKGCVNNLYEIPVIPLNDAYKNKIKRITSRLKPIGENSITEAVKKAIHQLSRFSDKKAIVIISGGRETCSFSPCEEISEQLRKTDITLHAIGLSIEDRDTLSEYSCISRIGNGTFFQVGNPNELTNALVSVVKELNSNLKVNIWVTSGHLYEGNVSGSLYIEDTEIPYLTDKGHPLYFSAVPGKYILQLEHLDNNIHISKEINDLSIESNQLKTIDVMLDMGKINIDIFSSTNHKMTGPVSFNIFNAGTLEEKLSFSGRLPFRFYLPPGTYDFLLGIDTDTYKNNHSIKNVSILNGKVTYETLNLKLGELNLSVYQNGNIPMSGQIQSTVYPSENPEHKIFSTVLHPAEMLLPPGKYDLHVSINSAGYRKTYIKKNVMIKTGNKTNEFIDLALGKININVLSSMENVMVDGIKFIVYKSDDKDNIIDISSLNPATLFLPPGKYDLKIDFNSDIKAKWENGIVVAPGTSKKISVQTELKLFEVKFYMKYHENVDQMVDTYIYHTGKNTHPVNTISKSNVKVFLPQNTYDIRFDLHLEERTKTFWKKNVLINSENYQSFNVTFPDDEI